MIIIIITQRAIGWVILHYNHIDHIAWVILSVHYYNMQYNSVCTIIS